MVFSAFLGSSAFRPAWQAALRQHALWLGLPVCDDVQSLTPTDVFAWGWVMPAGATTPFVDRTQAGLVLTTTTPGLTGAPASAAPGSLDDNLIRVEVDWLAGQTRVRVPPATPEPFYFRRDHRGWMLGNDLRLLMRWATFSLDERGVYALYQYGAIPAPITLAHGVERVPNGHTLALSLTASAPDLTLTGLAVHDTPNSPIGPGPGEAEPLTRREPETRLQQTLDSVLSRLPPAPTLFFSGGIDSSLLAARLVTLGVSDVRLINFSFGSEDREAEHAQQVASHLGLRCDQVTYRLRDVVPMLARIGQDYSFPFGDRSVIPTNLLVQHAIERQSPDSVIVEGTGADGAFGAWAAHSRLAALPRLAQQVLAGSYAGLRLWRETSEAERVTRLARGSLQMPAAHAFVAAQNVLDQIAYAMPAHTRRALETAIRDYMEVFGTGLSTELRYSLLDLIHVCAGIFAAKSYSPLRAAGLRPVYPFLEPAMFRLSASMSYAEKSVGHQRKLPLRRLLARQLPPALIERPKSGFVPPLRAILADPEVQAYTRAAVLSDSNPLRPSYRVSVVRQLFDRTAAGAPLSNGAYKFLWSLIFASCWLRQVEC